MRSLPAFGSCFAVPRPGIRALETDSLRPREPRALAPIALGFGSGAAGVPYRPPRSKYGVHVAVFAQSRDVEPPIERGV